MQRYYHFRDITTDWVLVLYRETFTRSRFNYMHENVTQATSIFHMKIYGIKWSTRNHRGFNNRRLSWTQ